MTRAWLIFISVSSICAAALASIQQTGITTANALISLVFGALISGVISFKHAKRWVGLFWLRADPWNQGFFLILLLGGSISFFHLFGEVLGTWGGSNPNNLGDLPLHLHFINFFARGGLFPPMDPSFAGEALHYPYGMDLWDALWVKLGVPIGTMLVITGISALLVSLIALWRAGDLVLVCAFFLSGGIASHPNWQNTFGPSSPLFWKNLFYAVFVTQRGFLFALPAGVYLIRKWNRFLNEKDFRLNYSFFWIFAALPFFHLHTFVVISFWMGLTILLNQETEFKPPQSFRDRLRHFPWGLVPAAALALFFILRSVTTSNVQGSVSWNWGWMFTGFSSVINNLGPWVVLPFFVMWRWVQQKRWKQLVIAVTLTFFAINLQLAPWAWDQVKVLMWVYLLWTFWAVQEYKWKAGTAALFSLFLFWPGAMQWFVGWPSQTGRFEIQDGADRASVEKLISDLSPNEVVVANVDHRHPLLGLGQSLALGYAGHAWSHGLGVQARQEGLNQILAGTAGGLEAAQQWKVSWLVWKDSDELSQTPPLDAWASWGWTEEKRIGKWHLWKVLPKLASPEGSSQ